MLTIPVERIEQRARQARPGKALLTLLVTVPFAVGWAARKVWLGAAFMWLAVGTGWREAGDAAPAAARDPFGGR